MPMKICIIGASGKMGVQLIELLSTMDNATYEAGISQKTSPDEAEEAFKNTDIIIDFSLPRSTIKYLPLAAIKKIPYVIGTTGFNAREEEIIKEVAKKIPIVKSGNMSLGVNLLASLVEQAAKTLCTHNFDVSIIEMHHKHKKDKPSGTALLLGEAAEKNQPLNIEYNSLRGGTVIGDHQVVFAGLHERVVLSHFAEDRKIFAQGALKAAFWVQDKPPSLYNMQDVLNIL